MTPEINTITKLFFQKQSFEEISEEELNNFINQYPYSSVARFLVAKKNRSFNDLTTAGFYFSNSLLLDLQLSSHEVLPAVKEAELPSVEKSSIRNGSETAQQKSAGELEPLTFQSYHTIDYFASQGIRLQAADLGKDRLGQQLKSFTEWLRSMKKLPTSETSAPATLDNNVIQNAASSIEEKEVLTEAMAEVWLKQGNREKARDVYLKLSLQNPGKSAYFAAKIDQIK